MGLFGTSKKKSRHSFQAAVEQHQGRAPAATLRARQSESAYRRNADYFRGGSPSPWQEGTHEHPYKQPGFGFYSGENLAAARPHAQEAKRSLSLDDGFKNTQEGFLSGPSSEARLPFSLPQMSAGSSCWDGAGYDADCPPWMDLGPWADAEPWDSSYRSLPYHAPEEQIRCSNSPYFDLYEPRTRAPPILDRSVSNGRRFTTCSPPFHRSTAPGRPAFDTFRPLHSTRTPNPYTPDQGFRQDAPLGQVPTWNGSGGRSDRPFSHQATASRPPSRRPGSYERLKPPHLQRGNSAAGSGTGTRSSSSRLGDVRFR